MAYRIHIEKQGHYRDDIDKINRGNGKGSLPENPTISTKIKPIDIEDANSEIEKGEIVLDPETGTLHKALGKPHAKGGTPVNLKDGSFIFSNFKNLAISKKEKELFEFKLGGKKAKNNTPSKILEKEVDIEHHNKMVDILQNEKKYDASTVNAAKLMLTRNLEKAGQVAFLQEEKKDEAIPTFAQNTAPVYSKDTDEKITESMQYLQKGGYNLPQFQDGTRKLTPEEKRLARQKKLEDLTGWTPYGKEGNQSFYKKYRKNSGKKMSNEDWLNFLKKETPEHKAQRQANQTQYGYTEPAMKVLSPEPIVYTPKALNTITPAPKMGPGNPPDDANGIIDRKNYNTKLTPWQKLNMAIPFYRAATVKTQYPLRQHQESVIPQFENQNVQPLLNQNNQAYFNSANTLRTLNPTQASSYAQQLYGNRTDANNQAIGQVQNNNIQIQNRQKEMAASSLNNDAAQNRAFDLKFYDQTQTAIKNRDELKQAYEQQGIQGINDTMSKKLAFDSWLNTQQQYRGKKTYIDKDGIQHYEGVAPYTPKAGFFGYSVQNNPTNIDWSTYQGNGSKVDSGEELGRAYLEAKKYDDTLKFADFLKYKGLQNFNTNANNIPQSFMKGGRFNKPKKNKLY